MQAASTTLAFAVVAALLALPAGAAGATGDDGRAVPATTTYHVSPAGDDAAAGTSPQEPWRTLSRASRAVLAAGDRVLLEAGVTHAGTLVIDAADGGTPKAPILVGSYGVGRARIWAGTTDGVRLLDTAGAEIRGLEIVGSGRSSNTGSGISVYSRRTDVPVLPYLRIRDITVRRFGAWGVIIGAEAGAAGYADVRVERVTASANGEGGILTWAGAPRTHRDIVIADSRAYANPGVPGLAKNSGNGIVLGSTAGGVIERCLAYRNGGLNDGPEGGAGIWTYDSDRVVIQHNESYANRTGGPTDGDGFDLDQNTTNAVVQFNYSHGNDGAGYLLAHGPATGAHSGNVVRFNVSENDGRRNGYGAIQLWGRITDAEISRNTVFLRPPLQGRPEALSVSNWSVEDRDVRAVAVRGNIFQTTGGLRLLEVTGGQVDGMSDLTFSGNAWSPSGWSFDVGWGGRSYPSLARWRSGSGQETSGGIPTGWQTHPGLARPGAGVTLGDPALLPTLDGYRLRPASPLVDRGLVLPPAVPAAPAPHDFAGGPVVAGVGPDVGAFER